MHPICILSLNVCLFKNSKPNILTHLPITMASQASSHLRLSPDHWPLLYWPYQHHSPNPSPLRLSSECHLFFCLPHHRLFSNPLSSLTFSQPPSFSQPTPWPPLPQPPLFSLYWWSQCFRDEHYPASCLSDSIPPFFASSNIETLMACFKVRTKYFSSSQFYFSRLPH